MGTTRNIKTWIWAASLLSAVSTASAEDTSPPSLVIHDEDISNWGDFSLDNTLQAIIDTNVAETGLTEPAELLATMLNAMDVSQQTNEGMGQDTSIPLQPIDVHEDVYDVDAYVPIALFNRSDAHAKDWSNCGEQRIVYEHEDRSFWIIFEAIVPNPVMRNGMPDPLGCAPVLDLWTSMEDWDTQVRGEELQRFFYEGRGPVGAVVTHGNYAVGGGQIRTNGIGFGNSTGGWVLHEFRADSCASRQSNCTPGQSLLRMDTVKGTPLSELFRGDQPIGAVIDTDTWDDLVDEWTMGFSTGAASGMIDDNDNGIADRLEELLSPELRGTDPQTGFGLTVEAQFQEFQSNTTDTSFMVNGDAVLQELVQHELDQLLSQDQNSEGRVTTQHVMNRAASQSCMGCHKPAIGANSLEVAPNVTFPRSNGFTHVRDGADSVTFSEALTDHFFPARDNALRQAAVALTPFRADMNRDGVVDGVDIGMFFAAWNNTCDGSGATLAGDMNGDCVVDGADVGHFLSQWGDVPSLPQNTARTAGTNRTVAEAEQAVLDAITPKQRRDALDALLDLRADLEWARQQDRQGHSVH